MRPQFVRVRQLRKVIRARYDETGKSDFEVPVDLHVGDVLTAEITFTWAVRAPRG